MIKTMNAASLTFEQSIANSDGETVCTADVTVACLEAGTFRPRRIPPTIKETLPHDA